MKRTPLRRRSKKPQAKLCRLADKLWGELIHRRNTCALSDSVGAWIQPCAGRLEAHHLISRSVRHLRHDPINGILLCSLHHKFSATCSAHGAPLAFAAWVQEHLPDTWAWVITHHGERGKPDYEAAIDKLTAALRV